MVMGELPTKVDVAVIGGGPGGYTAAIRAAQLGLDVVLIEKNKLGGICTNVGCIPSKALIHAAEVKHSAETSEELGITAAVKLDLGKTQQWKQKVVDELSNGIAALCRMHGIEVIKGKAFFTSSSSLSVEGEREIDFGKAVIATGTRMRELKNLAFDHERIIDSNDALSLTEVPGKMLIIGGGYIAVEMACLYLMLGSKVTISYRGERLLKRMEPEISKLLEKKIGQLGGEVIFHSTVEKTEGSTAFVKTPDGERKVEFDKLLVAIGRATELEGLGLEKTKAKIENGLVKVDDRMRTDDENIFAIGDIVHGPALAHKAFREGKVAAEVIAGQKSAYDSIVPIAIFSYPEIASVGLTEEQAKQSRSIKTGRMPFSVSGRAKTMGQKDGFVKIIADENDVILGVHIIGPGACSIIAEATLAIEMGARLDDLALTIHAHPTLPESLAEAAEAALGKAIHIKL